LRLRAIAPGHGHLIDDPKAKIQEYIDHRLAREAQVLELLTESGSATIDQLVEKIYVDVAAELHPVARYTVWAHLRKLAEEGQVQGEDLDGPWGPAGFLNG
jgi:predicted ArsR family transcriptional regulator